MDVGGRGVPLEVLGCHSKVISGVLACRGGPFWWSGCAPGGLRRAVVAKVRLPLSRPPLFLRFWRPKGAEKAAQIDQNRSNMDSNIYELFCLILHKFLKRFLMSFERFLRPWTFENELFGSARCYFSEIHICLTKVVIGQIC